MEENTPTTLERIQEAAMTEFLDKGFLGASLRQIVKNAGVTTGAFYGYFSSKEALFASIVEPHAKALMGRFMEAQTSFAELPEEQQPEHMGIESSDCVHWMVDYICQHRQAVKLLLCRAEGTGYEQFIHNMVEVEVESTLRYMEVLRHLGRDVPELSRSLCHIIASGMFSGLFEIPGAGTAGRGTVPPVLHRRMAEIDGGMTPVFFGYWLVIANFQKEVFP
jgi:AcrR family transcriptional regulator